MRKLFDRNLPSKATSNFDFGVIQANLIILKFTSEACPPVQQHLQTSSQSYSEIKAVGVSCLAKTKCAAARHKKEQLLTNSIEGLR